MLARPNGILYSPTGPRHRQSMLERLWTAVLNRGIRLKFWLRSDRQTLTTGQGD